MPTKKPITASSAPKEPAKAIPFEHQPDFNFRYSNNVRFHSTVHDLTLVFGQSDTTGESEIVRQHTAITMPWAVAKLALYYLQLNIVIQEGYNGKIPVPKPQIPSPLPEPTQETIANDPSAYPSFEAGVRVWEAFMDSLPRKE